MALWMDRRRRWVQVERSAQWADSHQIAETLLSDGQIVGDSGRVLFGQIGIDASRGGFLGRDIAGFESLLGQIGPKDNVDCVDVAVVRQD